MHSPGETRLPEGVATTGDIDGGEGAFASPIFKKPCTLLTQRWLEGQWKEPDGPKPPQAEQMLSSGIRSGFRDLKTR